MSDDDVPDVEEGEEFDEDEELDEDEDVGKASKKRKKEYSGAQFFLDNEAEVDDSEEEDVEAEEEGVEGFLDNAPSEELNERRNYRPVFVSKDRSVEEIARELEERHRHYDEEEDQYSEDEAEGESAIKQQSLLPSVRDPKLWMIKCKIGKERMTVINLMQKFLNKANDPDKLFIKSVISPDHLKGYIYIEAEKEIHVKNAIKGIRTLQQWDAKLVPIKEMRDVLTVTKKNVNLQKGDWVRVKRGLYRGDIAQVYESDIARGRITVKLIPRLDFANPTKNSDEKRKRANRMAPRFFNPDELGQKDHVDRRLDPHTKEPYYVFGGNKYKDGYLLKTMNIKSLETNNVVPMLEELQKFQNTPDREDQQELAAVASDLKPKRKHTFVKGDTVKVIEGDLKHLMGIVESVDDNTVNIIPKHQDLHDILAFPASQLQKYFKMGDHVKVISGRYEGETGLIVRLQENTVVIFSDLTLKEIKVLAQDIQECSDVTSGKVQLGNYELHDLVQINPQTVGVIVKVERESFRVLDNNGNLQTISLAEIGNKRNSKDATSFDAHQNPISIGDVVKVTEGQFKGRQGIIKHIFKYFVFLHSRDMVENSGVFVVRSGNCAILGGTKRGSGSIVNSPRNVSMSPAYGLKSPARNTSQANRPYRDNIVVNRRRRDDSLLHQTVTIKSGQWKGYVGIVKDATDTTARVELHTNCKTITVNKDMLQVSGGSTSNVGVSSAYPPNTPIWEVGGRTPMREDIMATPMRGDATPLRTPGTPLRTPVHGTAWDPSQPNTPMRSNSWDSDYSNSWTPDYTVSTPGQYQPSNAYSPFSPAPRHFDNTPNSDINPTTPSSTYTPGYDITPSTNFTPSNYDQRTPQDITTPYSYSASTPYQQPQTPGTPLTPHTPLTPGGDAYDQMAEEKGDTVSNWHTTDIEVKILGGGHRGNNGVIRELLPEGCKVALESGEMVIVTPQDLQPVKPSHKGNIKIIQGELKGNTGVLIGIDGADGIVKMSSNLDIKILDLTHLAVYQPA